MELMSWNVNGIRAVMKKGFIEFVRKADPDILCLQETRMGHDKVDVPLRGYHAFWCGAEKKGYSGTAVFTKDEPLQVAYGMGKPEHDKEGRLITLEYPDWFLVNVYTPNSGRGLARLDYRTREWDPAFLRYVRRLDKTKPVVFCGDLNVAHKEIDLARPKANERNAGFTIEERRGFDKIVKAGFVDTFREFAKEGGRYTWWSYMGNARAKNVGWRIDYFCVSPALRERLKAATILPEVMGSDHCPITLTLA